MSAPDLAALRAAAVARLKALDAVTSANHAGFLTDDYFAAVSLADEASEAFAAAASPAAVLALLDRLERAEEALRAVAAFPSARVHQDLTFSEATARMAEIARAALGAPAP